MVHASWWREHFTAGVDPEYEEQILPLAVEHLAGARRILDIGTGEGQLARAVAGVDPEPDLVIGVEPVLSHLEAAVIRAGGPVYVRGVAEHLPVAEATVDGVVVCLVLEHIVDHETVITEVARVLEPGGRFVLFLNHPLLQAPGSGWVDDHVLDEQYWRVGGYLDVDVSGQEVAPGVVLPFVHRPLSDYVNAICEAGFVVERMEEPAPPPGFLARAPEYADQARFPRLLLLVARRLAVVAHTAGAGSTS